LAQSHKGCKSCQNNEAMFIQETSTRAETPIAFIQAMIEAYQARGLDPSPALEKAQIAPNLLSQKQARVTALQMEWMSEAAMRELDDEALGWFRRRLPWGSYGMLARASVTAPNLGVAMKRWCRHHNLLTDDVSLHLHTSDGLAHIELQEHPARHSLGRFREFCTVSVLRNALGVACWLTDSRITLSRTDLHFERPAHADSYRVLFDGPVQFNAAAEPPLSRISFDAGYLSLPVRRDEAALQRMLQRALLLTVRPYRRDRLLVEKVRQVLAEHVGQAHNAHEVAAHLGLSTRTLHRQLKEEGSTLQQLKDSVRRERALALLLKTRKPIKQIAAEVGFANDKSFMRAFRLWTGKTVEEMRVS
jgi:AraC-like DNA-binding protein